DTAVPPPLQRHRNRLYLRVRFDTLASILPPPARLLVTSERHRVIEPHAAIDPYSAGFDPAGELVSQTDVARPDARRQTILGVIRHAHDTVEILIIDGHCTDHGAEDLFLHHSHVAVGFRQHRRPHDVPFTFNALAPDHTLSSLSLAALHEARPATYLRAPVASVHLLNVPSPLTNLK